MCDVIAVIYYSLIKREEYIYIYIYTHIYIHTYIPKKCLIIIIKKRIFFLIPVHQLEKQQTAPKIAVFDISSSSKCLFQIQTHALWRQQAKRTPSTQNKARAIRGENKVGWRV